MKLTLKSPVRPLVVAQAFGVNGAYYQANGLDIIGHDGLDLKAFHGEPIFASHDGQAFYEIDNYGGHGVVLITNTSFDYNGSQAAFKTIYWHMCDSSKEPKFKSPIEGNPWVQVKAGDLLGYADSTGLSTGDHLHFGLKPVTPNEPPQSIATLVPNNGYLGCIDPTPYLAEIIIDLKYGDTGDEVLKLQSALSALGYFTGDFYPHYGDITRAAVFAFQKDHIQLSFWERLQRGFYCGPKTRGALNNTGS